MEVHFSPDIEERLEEIAAANGKNAEQLVKDVIQRMVQDQSRFTAGVRRGIAQADRGEFIEHDDVLKRFGLPVS